MHNLMNNEKMSQENGTLFLIIVLSCKKRLSMTEFMTARTHKNKKDARNYWGNMSHLPKDNIQTIRNSHQILFYKHLDIY